jgi:two-component system, cell cycle response regulator
MKILVADDDAVSRRVLEAMLVKWGYEVATANDGAEAWDVLQGPEAPQLAILDWMMPNMDGPDVCRQIRAHPEIPYVYILLLTGRNLERDLIEGLEAGADDYLTKPFSAQELKVRLFSGKRILHVQAQLIAAREELRLLAIRDPLTGLFNRRYMEESFEREVHRAARNNLPLGAVMIDLDHFKRFNDTWGHPAGDAVLREVGGLLKNCSRGEDIACRYGGEEFTLILTTATAEATRLRAEQFRQAARGLDVQHEGRSLGGITISAGVAAFPEHGCSAAEILRAADKALYQAKAAGRDRVVVSQSAIHAASLD